MKRCAEVLLLVCVVCSGVPGIFGQGQQGDLILMHEDPGAVCLDGSPAGYYLRRGHDEGAQSWVIMLEGGGWCYNEKECVERSHTDLGSSSGYPARGPMGGILSSDPSINPDYSTWNAVFLKYCDGASFSGNKAEPINVEGTALYFRGRWILEAVIDNLHSRGLATAREVIFCGRSAGGIAAFEQLDFVRSKIAPNINVVGLANSGYFLEAEPWQQGTIPSFVSRMQYVFKMQEVVLNQRCINTMSSLDQWKCFFAKYLVPFIGTPFFVFNSAIDSWQNDNILGIQCYPPNCPPAQEQAFSAFHLQFLSDINAVFTSHAKVGWFLSTCPIHSELNVDGAWNVGRIRDQTAARTFGNWYYNRNETVFGQQSLVDCFSFPCNENCAIETWETL